MAFSDEYSLASFDFHLPESLIAQSRVPLVKERLLHASPHGEVEDLSFLDWIRSLDSSVALVLNDTKVVKARLMLEDVSCVDPDGGIHLLAQGEIFVYEIIDEQHAEVLVSDGKHFRPGWSVVLEREGSPPLTLSSVSFQQDGILMSLPLGHTRRSVLEEFGSMPLPPYISESEDSCDKDYQTEFASHEGSVAAPTAGLRFGNEVLALLDAQGVSYDFITLHVGLGTFKPLARDDVRDNELHREHVCVSQSFLGNLCDWKLGGKKIIGVGTTSCRVLESLPYVFSSPEVVEHSALSTLGSSLCDTKADTHDRMTNIQLEQGGEELVLRFHTQLFIYPGFSFFLLDGLLTNFHLPKTSLLVLVASLLGSRDALLGLYEHAVAHLYRFYSFGDAMLVWRQGVSEKNSKIICKGIV